MAIRLGWVHSGPWLGGHNFVISSVEPRSSADLFAAPLEGMRRGMERTNRAAENLAEGEITPENVVGLMQGEALVKANAAYFRTVENVLGSLLNTRA